MWLQMLGGKNTTRTLENPAKPSTHTLIKVRRDQLCLQILGNSDCCIVGTVSVEQKGYIFDYKPQQLKQFGRQTEAVFLLLLLL